MYFVEAYTLTKGNLLKILAKILFLKTIKECLMEALA